jgi:undecaprenyl-phosphate 4-deoxy-4-formamido-L-arabinose transferase
MLTMLKENLSGDLANGYSVVIPVYKSTSTLALLRQRIGAVFAARDENYEIVFVNDGGADDSWGSISMIVEEHDDVVGICLMRNYGQHNALLAGIRAARFKTVITMDDDLQHPPEEIPAMIRKFDEGYDVVYGSPLKEQHGLLRDIASIITKTALQAATGKESSRQVSAFRIFRTNVREAFGSYNGPLVSVDVLLTWGATKFAAVRVRHDERQIGKSNYNFGKLVRHAVDMMTGFSVLPLQMGSFIGFGFTVFGLIVLLYVLLKYMFYGSSVAGFPFLASIIAIFSGAQLFALGIMGEYLARIHFRTMDKPTYTISKIVRAKD